MAPIRSGHPGQATSTAEEEQTVAEGDDFARRLLVSVDASGYGRSNDREQGEIQKGLLRVLDDAAERAGLWRGAWLRQQAGDGELSILPQNEPEARVADDFVRHLLAALRRHNRGLTKPLRLRLAVHHGVAIPAPNGHRGAGPVVVSRLCDAAPLKRALEVSGAELAVILSRQVFTETVAQEHTSLDPAIFREVRVRAKEYDDSAWIWIPDHDVHGLDLRPPPGRPDEPSQSEPSPTEPSPGGSGSAPGGNLAGATFGKVGQVVGGDVTVDKQVFELGDGRHE